MIVHVNGSTREIAAGSTVTALLNQLQIPADRTAVEVNGRIVDPHCFDETAIVDEDRIEIVTFVGGG